VSDSVFKQPGQYASAIPRRDASEFLQNPFAQKTEGAGKAGCSLHPQPRVRNKTKHTSVVTTGSDGFNPAFPAQWFTRLDASIGASEPHDFTVREPVCAKGFDGQ